MTAWLCPTGGELPVQGLFQRAVESLWAPFRLPFTDSEVCPGSGTSDFPLSVRSFSFDVWGPRSPSQ